MPTNTPTPTPYRESMGTILIVEDQSEIRRMYQTALRRCGYHVIATASGNEAMLAMGMEFPDLVLLDMSMPGMDGLAFLQVLRQTPEWLRIPVILISAFASDNHAALIRELGATDHLVKSEFSIKQLRDLVAQHLAAPAGRGTSRVAV